MAVAVRTDERILAAALDLFAGRGFGATSLDSIAAELGLRKQTILYWFPSKEALLDAVIERSADELAAALDEAVAGAAPGIARIEAAMRTVFRFAVRRPAVLELLRDADRLGNGRGASLAERLAPLAARAVAFVEAEMAAGTIRPGDARLMVAFTYSTVLGVVTDSEAQRAVGWTSSPAELRRLRRELFAYVRAAVIAPGGHQHWTAARVEG